MELPPTEQPTSFSNFTSYSTLQHVLRKSRNYISGEGWDWKCIPPYNPHFGGLWEAAVKIYEITSQAYSRQQLNSNEWMYAAPYSEVLTVLCSKHEPTDIILLKTGKLRLNSMCKAYGSRIVIQAQATSVNNSTIKDINPPLSLEYDCCRSGDQNFKLNEIRCSSLIFVLFRNGHKSNFNLLMLLMFFKVLPQMMSHIFKMVEGR
jgi:hypothetical protein